MTTPSLTPWQRERIINRCAEGFSARAKRTLDAALTDHWLRELFVSLFPGEGIPADDAARYQELVAALRGLSLDQAQPIMREIEAIKNRYDGLAPLNVAQASLPAGALGIRAQDREHGAGMLREPAGKDACATLQKEAA